MNIELTPLECRIIGSLIEKQITTPDYYPLSLNALTNACNQKSNRDPVMDLDVRTVEEALEGLKEKHLVAERSGFGSRVQKYKHRFCNTEFGTVRFDERELGVVTALMLRGPQTPGELRSHTGRLCSFPDVAAVETTLQGLMDREDGPWVARLPREPGKRESRYTHLLDGSEPLPEPGDRTAPDREEDQVDWAQRAPGPDRIAELEARIEVLERAVARLAERLGQE